MVKPKLIIDRPVRTHAINERSAAIIVRSVDSCVRMSDSSSEVSGAVTWRSWLKTRSVPGQRGKRRPGLRGARRSAKTRQLLVGFITASITRSRLKLPGF